MGVVIGALEVGENSQERVPWGQRATIKGQAGEEMLRKEAAEEEQPRSRRKARRAGGMAQGRACLEWLAAPWEGTLVPHNQHPISHQGSTPLRKHTGSII